MTAGLESFLSSVGAFAALDGAELEAVAARCTERTYRSGTRLLSQGSRNQALLVLRSGQVAVRVHRAESLETIAHLEPPAVLGEVSFITGRTCSASIDIVSDARVVELTREALASLPHTCDRLIRGLAALVADRLHSVIAAEGPAPLTPAVLLTHTPRWAAPRAFALEFSRALARESGGHTLLVDVTARPSTPSAVHDATDGVAHVTVDVSLTGNRDDCAARLAEWRSRAASVVMAPAAELDSGALPVLATHRCALLGPGDPLPTAVAEMMVAQDARTPSLPVLHGSRQLIPDVVDAEAAVRNGRAPGAAFLARVGSLARHVLGHQVGIALGAGGARGWSHVGVLDVLHRGGLPIDLVAGTSMGAVVGGLWANGATAQDLVASAAEWHRRRLTEWRVWRMHMTSERRLDALFHRYYGTSRVNRTAVPFWANAVDIESGQEVVLRDGELRRAVRASMSFPGWVPPTAIDGRLLVDGSLVRPAPAATVRSMGAGFVVTALAITPMAPRPLARRLPMRAYDLVTRSLQISGVALSTAGSDGDSDVVVAPDLGDATMLSFSRDRELIAAGAAAAEGQLAAIRESYARLKRRASRSPQ